MPGCSEALQLLPAQSWPPQFGQLSSYKDFQPLWPSPKRKPQSASHREWVLPTQACLTSRPVDTALCSWKSWGGSGGGAPARTPGPWEQPQVTWSLPQTQASPIPTPSQPMRDCLHTWLPPGTGPGLAPALPGLPAQSPLNRLWSWQSQAPPPAGDEAGTLGCWEQGARPNSWHCHPDTQAICSRGQTPRGGGTGTSKGCSSRQVWCGHRAGSARCLPTLSSVGCQWSKNTGPTTPSNLPTPATWCWRDCLVHGEGYIFGSRDFG